MKKKRLNVIFMGTPDIAVPALELLYHHPSIHINTVVSMPDRKANRGQVKSPEVITFAKANKIPTFQTANINKEDEFIEKIKNDNIDFILVFAFAQFISKTLLDLPRLGCFNIHTSLLPKYRGAAPIQYALLNDDKTTGVTIQKMVKKMDAGDIVFQEEVSIHPSETASLLYTKLKFLSPLILEKFIGQCLDEKLSFMQQNEDHVSLAPTLSKEFGHIHFNEMTANEVFNRFRACHPWPSIFSFAQNKRLKFLDIRPLEQSYKTSFFTIDQKRLFIGCKEGSIEVLNLQLEGKKAQTALEFINAINNNIELKEGSLT